jgi:hypothetical protein
MCRVSPGTVRLLGHRSHWLGPRCPLHAGGRLAIWQIREEEGMAHEMRVKMNDGDRSIDFIQGAEDRQDLEFRLTSVHARALEDVR